MNRDEMERFRASGGENEKDTVHEIAKTEDDKTLAEDEQSDNNSGNMDNKFERTTVTLTKQKGKRFGLGIILVHQRIMVCKVDDDSLVSGVLRVGDQIQQIDGITVLDKVKCKNILTAQLSKNGSAELQLIRPKTKDALCAIMEEIQLSKKPSVENFKAASPLKKPG